MKKVIETEHIMNAHWRSRDGNDIQNLADDSGKGSLFTQDMKLCSINMIKHYYPKMDDMTKKRADWTLGKLKLDPDQ